MSTILSEEFNSKLTQFGIAFHDHGSREDNSPDQIKATTVALVNYIDSKLNEKDVDIIKLLTDKDAEIARLRADIVQLIVDRKEHDAKLIEAAFDECKATIATCASRTNVLKSVEKL